MPAFGRDHFFARILGRRAGIPDRQVGGAQTALQVLTRGGRFVVQRQRYRGLGSRRNVGAQRQQLRFPGQQSTVQIVITAVADDIQQPDETPGPAAAFVIVDDIHGVGIVA